MQTPDPSIDDPASFVPDTVFAGIARSWARSSLTGLYFVEEGIVRWGNDQFLRDTEFTLPELAGRRALSLVHPDDRELVRAHAIAMLRGQRTTPYEYRYITANGADRWALETVAPMSLGQGRGTFGNMMDITARKQLEAHLAYQAFHDDLTDLPNRALFLDRLGHALHQPHAGCSGVAVLYIDLDGFKDVNDRFGHHAGDQLLWSLGRRFQEHLPPNCTLARLGGDEFTVLVPCVSAAPPVLEIAEQLCASLAEPMIVAGHACSVTASIGVAVSSASTQQPQELLQAADMALYQAKAQGKDRAVLAA